MLDLEPLDETGMASFMASATAFPAVLILSVLSALITAFCGTSNLKEIGQQVSGIITLPTMFSMY